MKIAVLPVAGLLLGLLPLGAQSGPGGKANPIPNDPRHAAGPEARTDHLARFTESVSGNLPESDTVPATVHNYIDEYVFQILERDHIPRTGLCSDVEFLRRVRIDLAGRPPEPDKIREFVKDKDPKKRERLIDSIMATSTKGVTAKPSTPFLDRWTYFFADLFSVGNYNGRGRTLFHNYIYDALLVNQPYDEFVRGLLTATTRSSHNSAEGNFLIRYYVDEPDQSTINHEDYYDELAIRTGRMFLGINLECVSCHGGKGHLEKINLWLTGLKRDDLWKQAAFFSKLKLYRPYGDLLDEFVLTNDGKGYYDSSNHSVLRIPRYKAEVSPTFILTGEHPRSGEDPRDAFARMVTTNIQFARATVNMFWAELFGAGIVDPPTAFDLARYGKDAKTLPAGWTPQTVYSDLLDRMARDFQEHHFDVRYLLRLITGSATYQLSSRVEGPWKAQYASYFGRHLVHRLTAEAIWDTLSQATGVFDEYSAGDFGTKVKYVMQTVSPDDIPSKVLKALSSFGLVDRVLGNRSLTPSTVQSSILLNGEQVKQKLHADAKGSRLGALLNADPPKSNSQIVEELFLATLARYPTPQESAFGMNLLAERHAQGGEDLLWVLINKPEFQLNY